MAIPQAPDMLRPDLEDDCYKKLSSVVDKLNKFVEKPYVQIMRNHNWEPVFSYVKHALNPKSGYVVAQFKDKDIARIGYIVSVTSYSLDVVLYNNDSENNKRHHYTYTRIIKTHTYNNPSYTRPLMISEMTVDEFVKFVDEKVYEERHLDKRAKITNRELRQMREEIFLLKRNFRKLEIDYYKKNYDEQYINNYDSTLEELDL